MNIDKIIGMMSLTEKALLLSGKNLWETHKLRDLKVPSLCMADGPHGLRKQVDLNHHMDMYNSIKAVSFPTAACLANSWDETIVHAVGSAIAEHAKQEGVGLLLAPGVNIKRNPLCGRNFEYYSEDPLLSGRLASAMINGIQSQGIGATLKHFAVNNQEHRRMTINSVVDPRALHEIYLKAFNIAIQKSQPMAVMSAYNLVNGVYASENMPLLNTLLRNTYGFKGMVVSDWGATNDRVEGLKAGLDLEMPGPQDSHTNRIIAAVEAGTLDTVIVDQAVRRILTLINQVQPALNEAKNCDLNAQHALAIKAAEASLVLLKNDSILPLKSEKNMALIGQFAEALRFQGGGSSKVNPTKVTQLKELFSEAFYAPGYSVHHEHSQPDLIHQAVQAVENKDVVLVCLGLSDRDESEGFDRKHLDLSEGQTALIDALVDVHENIVVVLFGGSPITMPWHDKVQAIVHAYLPGQAGAVAIKNVLMGAVNPSGKLTESYPLKYSDVPSYRYFANQLHHQQYRESVLVGYRYYETADKPVLFPFGHGLSYTSFDYDNLHISTKEITDSGTIVITCDVRNVGEMAGHEIVQVYVNPSISALFKPVKTLVDFKKVWVPKGEAVSVSFTLDSAAFDYFNVNTQTFEIENGLYEIMIGASVRDIRLRSVINVKASKNAIEVPDYRDSAPSYYSLKSEPFSVSTAQFQALMPTPLPDQPNPKIMTLNTPIYEMQTNVIGHRLYKSIEKQVHAQNGNDMMLAMLKEIPLRAVVNFSQNKLPLIQAEGLVEMMNHHYIKGLRKIIKGMFKNTKTM